MIRLLKHFRWYYWLLTILLLALTILGVCADLRIPDLLTLILNKASEIDFLRGKGELTDALLNSAQSEIIHNGLLMLANALLSVSCIVAVAFVASRIAAGFAHDLRDKVYTKIQNLSLTEIDKFSTASLITRTTNDINQVQMVLVMVLRMALAAPFTAILGIINATAHAQKSNLNILVILAVISLTVLVVILFSIVYPKFKQIQKNTDDINLVTRENLTGIRVVRANNAQDYEEAKFNEVNDRLTKTNILVNRVISLLNPGINIIMNMTSLLILWIGAYAIDNGTMPIGNVFGFQQYTMMICMAFMVLIMIFVSVPRGQVSANRINEVLMIKNLISDPVVSKANEAEGYGEIEFKDVSFSYPGSDEAVLSHVSFSVHSGETLAIIGSTGSGKTTILNLMNRFYDCTEGEILIDGVNVKDYTQHELHDKIGLIPQKSNLFMGTIKSNLMFGNDNPTDEDIDRALRVSQSQEFVNGLKDGINSFVSQGGQNYSGGQRQRLCIARAIIKKSEIYAFDDSFSALDLKTDKALRDALAADSHKATNVIVAQRIGTIINADKIIVLDEGRIVGLGKHKELLDTCPVYKEIALSQLSKEEL